MARYLQQLLDGIGGLLGRSPLTAGVAAILAVGVATGACGPIEAERPEQGPPYIGEVVPSESIYRVSGDSTVVDFRATLYDPNRHDDLHVVWISSNQESISVATTDFETEVRHRGANLFQYEEVSQEFDPCLDGDTRGRETIWLYVSDQSFQSITPEAVEPAESAFITSRSWVLDYVCQ